MVSVIRGLVNRGRVPKGSVVTMGNFDGVHIGHQALLKKTVEKAEAYNTTSLAILFEPQPFEFFARETPAPRLTRFREKCYWLAKQGIDAIWVIRFNQAFSNLTAEQFVEFILKESVEARQVIIGDDFHFGRGRQGDFAFLKQHNIAVERMPTIELNGTRVSSTAVREALAASEHERVNALLGRPYTLQGCVVYGDQRGRQMGFPTANIYLHRARTPVTGVYSVRLQGISEKGLPGVANVGIRPTIGGTRSLLEVHLFDFAKDIYGRKVCVEFCEKIRDEKRFPDLDSLIEQIGKDAIVARRYFEERGEL